MKFLHTADLHIGKSRNLPNYLERQDKMLSEIYRIAEEEKVDFVLISGDIFDRKDLTTKEKDLFIKHICRADNKGIKNILINGNHDPIDEQYTQLRFLSYMISNNNLKNTVVIEKEPASIKLAENFYILAVPSHYYKNDEVNYILRTLIANINNSAEIEGKNPENFIFIAAVHETVLGSRNDMDVVFNKKGVILDSSLPIRYWALGDIHKQQSIPNLPNAWYSGSPIQHDFGDSIDKSVLIVDTNDPTNPKPVKLEGIIPLITLTEKPENNKWPEGLIRFVGTSEDLSSMDMPSNVVKTKTIIDKEEAIKFLKQDDMFDGLLDILADMGLSKEKQELAYNEALNLKKFLE